MRNVPCVFFPPNMPSICHNHSIQMGKAPFALRIVFLQPLCCIPSLASAGQLWVHSSIYQWYCKRMGSVSVRTVPSAILARELSWKESDLSMWNLSASLEYLHCTEATLDAKGASSKLDLLGHHTTTNVDTSHESGSRNVAMVVTKTTLSSCYFSQELLVG